MIEGHKFVKGENLKKIVEKAEDKRGLDAIAKKEYESLDYLDGALRTFNAYVGRSLGDLRRDVSQPLKLPMVITNLPVYYNFPDGKQEEIGRAYIHDWHP